MSSSQFAQELSKNANLLVRKLVASLSDQPLPVKEGIFSADFELKDPSILAQLHETERQLAHVKKIVKTVENEKNKMEVFIKSIVCRKAMLQKKCDNQQGLIRIASANMKESEKKVADLRVANLGLVRSLEEAKLELSTVHNSVCSVSPTPLLYYISSFNKFSGMGQELSLV
ncbi:hypothetical protein ACLB2K_029623 [Fragaria x ananassa]